MTPDSWEKRNLANTPGSNTPLGDLEFSLAYDPDEDEVTVTATRAFFGETAVESIIVTIDGDPTTLEEGTDFTTVSPLAITIQDAGLLGALLTQIDFYGEAEGTGSLNGIWVGELALTAGAGELQVVMGGNVTNTTTTHWLGLSASSGTPGVGALVGELDTANGLQVAKFDSAGLMTAFATDGTLLYADVDLQPMRSITGGIAEDGTVIVAATITDTAVEYAALFKIKADGTIDDIYGSGDGYITDPAWANFLPTVLTVSPDLGFGQYTLTAVDVGASWELWRHSASSGNTDGGFGTVGVVALGDFDDIAAILVDPSSGHIYVVGEDSNDIVIEKYDTAGVLVGAFGTGGRKTADFGSAFVGQVLAAWDETNSKVVVTWGPSPVATSVPAVARFNGTDGLADVTFSTDGTMNIPIPAEGAGLDSYAGRPAVQADGKILVPMSWNDGVDTKVRVARVTTAGAIDTTFGPFNTGYTAEAVLGTPGSAYDVSEVVAWSDDTFMLKVLPDAPGDGVLLKYDADGVIIGSFG